MELLAPAGSPDALIAAVQNGANAVYLGCGDFNARRRAKNFSQEDLVWAVSYCHVRGVKVYLTLNTLLTDKELPTALELAALANRLGVDAVLVQDLGLASALKRRFPDLPLHGSTQMTVHSLVGVELCAHMGLERVVLSRELSGDAIAHICQNSPIEIEVFVHGALCMCYSGQCFFSSLVGGRSGNRGLCAQPCRLPYNGENPLSLKDMSLAGHLGELSDMGVACVKLEGRMKRPEYVAVVTAVYAAALREGREPTHEELHALQVAFSRSGFTQGYYRDRKGPDMFGVRAEADAPGEDFYASARSSYQKERPLVDVTMTAAIQSGRELTLTVRDTPGREATALGPPPEAAHTHPLTEEDVWEQLAKTGGTPYRVTRLDVRLEAGLSVPKSALNALRRGALEELTALRAAPPQRRQLPEGSRSPCPGPDAPPQWVLSFFSAAQLPPDFGDVHPAWVELPLAELADHPDALAAIPCPVRVVLPTILWDKEANQVRRQLRAAKDLGVTDALVNTWDAARLAETEGFALHGDYGLGVLNSETLYALRDLGFQTATLSFEQKLTAIRHLQKPLPAEAIVYGRLPLMTLEQFPGGDPSQASLTDRKSVTFPVVAAPGGRAQVLNSQVLYLADKEEWKTAGLSYARFLFTTESPQECLDVLQAYQNAVPPAPQSFTRGLYYRDVE